jgi:hypothetical protein
LFAALLGGLEEYREDFEVENPHTELARQRRHVSRGTDVSDGPRRRCHSPHMINMTNDAISAPTIVCV